jgi:hypothetical protein
MSTLLVEKVHVFFYGLTSNFVWHEVFQYARVLNSHNIICFVSVERRTLSLNAGEMCASDAGAKDYFWLVRTHPESCWPEVGTTDAECSRNAKTAPDAIQKQQKTK